MGIESILAEIALDRRDGYPYYCGRCKRQKYFRETRALVRDRFCAHCWGFRTYHRVKSEAVQP